MKSFRDFLEEESPTTSTGPGIDMAPTAGSRRLYKKLDRRSRYDVNKMYERSLGLKNLPKKD